MSTQAWIHFRRQWNDNENLKNVCTSTKMATSFAEHTMMGCPTQGGKIPITAESSEKAG